MKERKLNKSPGKVRRTVLIVCALLLALIAAFALWVSKSDSNAAKKVKSAVSQLEPMLNHIEAAYLFFTTSSEEQQQKIEKAKEEQVNVLKDSGFNASSEASDALVAGKITQEEYTDILLGNTTLEDLLKEKEQSSDISQTVPDETQCAENSGTQEKVNDTNSEDVENPSKDTAAKENEQSGGKTETKPPVKNETDKTNSSDSAVQQNKPSSDNQTTGGNADTTSASNDVDKRVAELVTKMYVLKAEYTGAVNGVVGRMKADYAKLPKEQRTKSAKQSIAAGYLSEINTMEAQCDAQVNAIVAELRKILKENGRDTALADAIVSTYATEKANTKAYYISTYGD